MERVQRVIEELKKQPRIPKHGIFSTRNTVGDKMKTVFSDSDDEITIDFCTFWDYIEVFGLTDKEFEELKDWYNKNASWRAKMN